MGTLEGQAAIVTGASRGIGRAVALRLAKEGAALFLAADGTASELESAAEACQREGSPEARAGCFDLARPGAPEEMVEVALAALGGVNLLVNNAGIRIRRPFGAYSYEDFERLVAVDLRAPFFASQAVLPAMRAAGGGGIINIASQLGVVAARGTALYGLAKAALIHLTRAMALELASEGIAVNAISPGPTGTEYFLERLAGDPEERAQRLAYVPAGRFGAPEEVAAAVAFLASAESAFIQGHNLVVDGGYVIH